MIEAKVVEDTISATGRRLTTLQLKYPRFIHSEFMTHRVFSRNASSSRAIPIAKMIEQVRNDPAMPIEWGTNKPGMQAGDPVDNPERAVLSWRMAALEAAYRAEKMAELGLHKQLVNRVLEPFQWMHTIVTATDWDNFFTLRDHPAAQPEIAALARSMRTAMQLSKPDTQFWHIPYVGIEEAPIHNRNDVLMVSAARCARVSYLNHDGTNPDWERDLALAEKLLEAKHMSPFEHQAFALDDPYERSGNFRGWCQFRKELERA